MRLEDLVHCLEGCDGQFVAIEEVAEAQDGGGVRDAGGAGVDAREGAVHRDVVQRFTGRLVGEREPLLQEVDPQQQDGVGADPWPRRGEGGNPGDEGILRDDGEHLLEEGRPARALGGPLESAGEAQLVHATMIPGQAPTTLPFAVTP